MRGSRGNAEVVGDLVKGALAGAAATWLMGLTTSYLYEREGREAREREDDARGGKTAFGVAAEKGAALVGRDLSEEERQQYGAAVHWALGAGAGAVYAAARGRIPGARAGGGLLFGTAFWALVDEGANVAFGLTPGPTAFPWETHARGLAGHLVFGVAAEATLRVLDEIG